MDASRTQVDRIDINYEEAIWLQRKGEAVVGMAKTILFADVISGLLVCGIVDVNAKPGADTKDALFEAIIPWALSKEAKMIQVTNKEYTPAKDRWFRTLGFTKSFEVYERRICPAPYLAVAQGLEVKLSQVS